MKTIVIAIALVALGCTEQTRARHYGGTAKVDLPAGHVLVIATWKESGLWYLTKPAPAGHTPETLTFHESSTWGAMEGTVLFVEH